MEKTIYWAIQTNLIAENQVREVWDAVLATGAKTQEVIVVPFSEEFGNEIPDIGEYVIPYGSTKLNKMAQARGWKGNWFDKTTFRVDTWNANRDDMLNSDAIHMKVKDTINYLKDVDDDQLWFIRPLNDLKEFNGTVTATCEIKKWMSSVYSGNFSFTEDTEIIIAKPKPIEREARFFIVGGKVIDGSWYRIHGQLLSQPVTNETFMEEVQELADIWLPHRCCVMDVAVMSDGSVKVIEYNAINSTGFYYHNIPKIVKAMTDYLIENGN